MCVFQNVPFYFHQTCQNTEFLWKVDLNKCLSFCLLGFYNYSSHKGEEYNKKLLYAQNLKAGPSSPQEKLAQLLRVFTNSYCSHFFPNPTPSLVALHNT